MSQLNDEQSIALNRIVEWLTEETSNFFMLKGSAGTGKTFCIKELTDRNPGKFAYTAPTNKATKVLRESVTTQSYRPLCRTIYSLLCLTLSNDGEIKKLRVPKDPVDLSIYNLIIVDEASMISKDLFAQIELAAVKYSVRFLFMGDPAQLPPINENSSRVWEIGASATLTKVMRHDNAILELATRLRDEVDNAVPKVHLAANNDGEIGVWRYDKIAFEHNIKEHAKSGKFSKPDGSKVIAWRNVRVNIFNKMIRDIIFTPDTPAWVAGDRALFASVVKDRYGMVLAAIDDEGVVVNAEVSDMDGFKAWYLDIELDDGRVVLANPLHADSIAAYEERLRIFAEEARSRERKWQDYWDLKEHYSDMKYAYAITAHRSQGSTYDTAFVCWQDILRNQDANEAYRCLYVACTRPRSKLILS